jgi:hypothetical protein
LTIAENASDDEVLGVLRQRLDMLRREAEARGLFVERYAPHEWQPPVNGRLSPGLYRHLRLANQVSGDLLEIPFIGRASSIPILGPVIDALKRPLHDLVRVYVSYLARQVFAHEQRQLRVLNEVVDHTEPGLEESLRMLSARVAALEDEVTRLHAAQAGDPQ